MPRKKVKLPKRSTKGAYDDEKSIARRRWVPERVTSGTTRWASGSTGPGPVRRSVPRSGPAGSISASSQRTRRSWSCCSSMIRSAGRQRVIPLDRARQPDVPLLARAGRGARARTDVRLSRPRSVRAAARATVRSARRCCSIHTDVRRVVPSGYDRDAAKRPGDNAATAMKSVVADPSRYDWEGDGRSDGRSSRRSSTRCTSAASRGIRAPACRRDQRGTYAGLIEKIPYLQDLGITAVELLPVFQFDPHDAPGGRPNYWGYQPVSFFAPHHGVQLAPANRSACSTSSATWSRRSTAPESR